jgi:hypothetical protein
MHKVRASSSHVGPVKTLGLLRDGEEQSVPVTLDVLLADQMLKTFLGEPGVPKPKLPSQALVNFGVETAAITRPSSAPGIISVRSNKVSSFPVLPLAARPLTTTSAQER